MKTNFNWLHLFTIILFLSSCNKGGSSSEPVPVADTMKPTINLIDPTSNKNFILGSPLHLQMDLSDNIELKYYKVTITKNLKGIQTSDWAFNQTWPITAGKKTSTVNHSEIIVPLTVTGNQTTTGNYDMVITCTDTSGNEATTTITVTINKS
jgi:hypothetical protein